MSLEERSNKCWEVFLRAMPILAEVSEEIKYEVLRYLSNNFIEIASAAKLHERMANINIDNAVRQEITINSKLEFLDEICSLFKGQLKRAEQELRKATRDYRRFLSLYEGKSDNYIHPQETIENIEMITKIGRLD